MLTALCEEVGSNLKVLLLHTEVSWLSRGKVLNRLLQMREEVTILLEKERSTKGIDTSTQIKKFDCCCNFWLKMACLGDFFQK